MKRFLPLLGLILGLAFVASKLAPPRNPDAFDLVAFGRLPILANGRIKPLDTLARSSLLTLQGRQRISAPNVSAPLVASPTEWLLDVFFRPEKADAYPTFSIDNTELLAQVGLTGEKLKIVYTDPTRKTLAAVGFLPAHRRRFSLNELQPHFKTIDEQSRLADAVQGPQRSAYQRSVIELRNKLVQYHQLKFTLIPPGEENFLGTLLGTQEKLPAGVAAIAARQAGQPHDAAAAQAMLDFGQRAFALQQNSPILIVPPSGDETEWRSMGTALLDSFRKGNLPAASLAYAGLDHAWRAGRADEFNKVLQLYRDDLARRIQPALNKSAAEARFNAAEPFYASMTLYAFAFFLAVFSWLKWPDALGRTAFWLVLVAWLASTAGLAARMWLEGRPPVTNLYSSALFIGWFAVALCLLLEWLHKNAVASVVAGTIGFGTLLIAHHLSLSGDTLEMMRAVLDSNFWLATHVIVITAGYSATFIAGLLAAAYIVRGLFTRSLDAATGRALERMVYGIVCFATLFSLVGTILGGIWADQSWGRFWGWDPKENGALIIVLWNAIILHARWGALVKARGLMALAVFGNVVTGWSWFGTNLLEVGLHSYGFTSNGAYALGVFVASQLLIIALAIIPLEKWRSFAPKTPATP